MARGVGAVDIIQTTLPDWVALVAALVTQLGDAWFLTLLLISLVVTQRERREGILAVGGMLAVAIGLYRTLKHIFERPRPNEEWFDPGLLPDVLEPLYEGAAYATGYGFPSGHATSVTVAYLGLAVVLTVGTRRQRFGVAGVVVALVSASRVALGVHYLVDVVAGVALGAVVLAVGLQECGPRLSLSQIFGMGIAASLCYLVASGGRIESVLLLCLTAGLFVGWRYRG
ncbi:phosphatase PAP2 family protein [Halovenus salina]|uniref:Phosphatase PAP2 family protein n=1 Tax=Halovenus salina TaxID=1510225 RepID=A0ABD5W0N5_9EURY|nr:phosphatase PAP2 family protein [Halovenus salina]